ncbi:MAG: DUF4175 family protein, partial [Aestuariivirgaceae bacterium]
MIDKPTAALKRKLSLAKAALVFEQLWVALFPAFMVAGSALLLVLLGVPAFLPISGKTVAAGLFGAAFLAALWPLRTVRWPSDESALRRIEVRSGLKHRPATAWQDKMAEPQAGSTSRAIWMVHKQRMAAHLKALRAGWPRSGLPKLDPFALRSALAIALITAGFLNWGHWDRRLIEVVSAPAKARVVAGFDAWISPPAYTGKPPILLTGPAAQARLEKTSELLVPQGSLLVVRLNGANQPVLELSEPARQDNAEVAPSTLAIPASADTSVHETRTKLDRPVHISLLDSGSTLAEWRIAVIADAAPTAEISGELAVTPTGGFAVPWKAGDDYGVAGLEARFGLVDESGQKVLSGALDYEPPQSVINLQKLNPRIADGRAFMDFTAHPWAGMTVDMHLEASDQAQQIGRSEPVRFKLPQRDFRKLLAQAVIEQRRA